MIAPPPSAMYAAYREACAEAAAQKPSEWTFKRDPRYTPILEHVTYEQGRAYLDLIGEEFPRQWQECMRLLRTLAPLNDDLGKPRRFWYRALGVGCSPTNLRYLYHALRIWRHAERVGLTDAEVVWMVELGAGYGGLALYLRAVRRHFTPAPSGYVGIDIPESSALQRAYAKAIGLDRGTWFITPDQLDIGEGAPYLFISCYAFSEFDADTRRWYGERLLRHCPHGFMVWNGEAHPSFAGPPESAFDWIHPIRGKWRMRIEEERPLTGPGNKVLLW